MYEFAHPPSMRDGTLEMKKNLSCNYFRDAHAIRPAGDC